MTTPDRVGRRAVVLVGNPAAPYSRSLRIARTLADAGYEVEIAAIAAATVPDLEADGAITLRRYRPSGRFAGMAASAADPESAGRRAVRRRLPMRVLAAVRRWLLWPHTVRGWWATLARELPPADLYHACGSLTIAAALSARERDRTAGRNSTVIYDAVDDVAQSNNVLGMPRIARAIVARRERGWARAADARVTVNEALAGALARSWGTEPPLVIPNWPQIPGTVAGGPRSDRIRREIDVPAETRIVLFQGRLGPNLGLDEAAEAILRVPDAILCLIGFGRGVAASRERDADPRFAGRHRTLPAVHPDEILEWTASADVALIPLPPISANQRASTPNKFWEAIGSGTPVVVGPGLPVMASLVDGLGLGVVARSLAPDDLAAAIRAVLDVSPEEADARRRRIAQIAREQFAWPIAARRYRELVDRLDRKPGGDVRPALVAPVGRAATDLRSVVRPFVQPITRPARRMLGRLRVLRRDLATAFGARAVRTRRRATALVGPTARVLLYSAADLNVIDGSSIWMESAASILHEGSDVWLTVPLRAPEKRPLISDALRRLPRLELLPPLTFRSTAQRRLTTEDALDWIERLDQQEPFDAFVIRGFELCLAAAARPRFRGRLWSTYILEPERDPESLEYRAEMDRIAAASAFVVSQTDEMRAATEERVPAARGRTILLPPGIPASVPRADATAPVARLIYTGKFAPFYPVPDLIDAFARLRDNHPGLEFHIVGDKVWRPADNRGYADALDERVASVPGVIWHGGLSRNGVARFLAIGGIAISVWDYRFGSHWNDLVVSTKLLDYCAAGLPIVLTRTPTQARILGEDYPLFVDRPDEAEAAIASVLADPDLYRAAAERCWTAARPFTYEAAYEGLAPFVASVRGRGRGASGPGESNAGVSR